MNIIILGIPGSGKGTQCDLLSKKLMIPAISTGHILRQVIKGASTPTSREIKKTMVSGQLVSDEIMIQLVTKRLQEDDCKKGFLLDGFPRTMAQGQMLYANKIRIDYVFELMVSAQEVQKRMHGRLIHRPSGRIYNMHSNPPQQSGLDDITGEPLCARLDDDAKTVLHRLDIYHQQTEPLIEFYKSLKEQNDVLIGSIHKIIGTQPVTTLHRHLLNLIQQPT
jgi:adenylate kinase